MLAWIGGGGGSKDGVKCSDCGHVCTWLKVHLVGFVDKSSVGGECVRERKDLRIRPSIWAWATGRWNGEDHTRNYFGGAVDIRGSILDVLILRCLSDIQVEMSCRSLDICFKSQGRGAPEKYISKLMEEELWQNEEAKELVLGSETTQAARACGEAVLLWSAMDFGINLIWAHSRCSINVTPLLSFRINCCVFWACLWSSWLNTGVCVLSSLSFSQPFSYQPQCAYVSFRGEGSSGSQP